MDHEVCVKRLNWKVWGWWPFLTWPWPWPVLNMTILLGQYLRLVLGSTYGNFGRKMLILMSLQGCLKGIIPSGATRWGQKGQLTPRNFWRGPLRHDFFLKLACCKTSQKRSGKLETADKAGSQQHPTTGAGPCPLLEPRDYMQKETAAKSDHSTPTCRTARLLYYKGLFSREIGPPPWRHTGKSFTAPWMGF